MASSEFMRKIQPEVRNDEQSYYYKCSFLTRNGVCPSERGLTTKGPKNLSCCRRHAKMYDEERERLQARLDMDHASGLHIGEGRSEFAKQHEDTSSFFRLQCYKCRDELRAEELGVEPEKMELAQQISDYMASVQTKYDEKVKDFKELVAQDKIIYALDYRADDVRKVARQHAYCQTVIKTMNQDQLDIVDAFKQVHASVKDTLIEDSLHDEYDRAAAASFLKIGQWHAVSFEKEGMR